MYTARGRRHRLELSDTDEELGLRFAAGPFDDGDDPIALTAVLTDGSSFTRGYRRP